MLLSLINPIKPNLPDFMESFKTVFFHYFEQLVDNCCLRIEPEFSIHWGRERESTSKEYHKNVLEYLRSVRFEIKTNYLRKINDAFDTAPGKKENPVTQKINLASTSFISDDHVKEDYASNLIIRECEKAQHEQLTRLNHLIAVLSKNSASAVRHNPVAPENLIKPLLAVIKPLKFNGRQRVALYKTFEACVFNHLGFVYQELIKHCEASLKLSIENTASYDSASAERSPAEADSPEFRQLQLKLAQWRAQYGTSGFDSLNSQGHLYYENFEIQNALQVLGQFSLTTDTRTATEKLPIKRQILNQLEKLNFSDEAKTLTQADEDVLDLVSLIFSEIAAIPFLPESTKSAIGRLIMPMSAVSLGQYSVFTDSSHPVSCLVDQLIEAGLFLNFEHEADRLLQQRIGETINLLTSDFGFNRVGWTRAAKEFSQFLERYRENSRIREENSIQARIDYETLCSTRKAVADAIAASIQNKSLPPTVTGFLHDVWYLVMLQAYLTKHRQPETWEESVKAMNQLIISVTPPANDEERKRILKFIPEMIKYLRNGLTLISYNKKAQSRFFKELAVLQIIAMDNKGAITTETAVTNVALSSMSQLEARTEKKSDPFNLLLTQLNPGDWFSFNWSGERKWGKLARIGNNNENLLFVGKNGEKIVQIKTEYLAELVRLGKAAPIPDGRRPMTGLMLSALSAFPDNPTPLKITPLTDEEFCD